MPRQKELAQARRAGTQHSLPASPAVVALCGRRCQSETAQRGWPVAGTGAQGAALPGHPAAASSSSGQDWPLGMAHGTRQLSGFPCPVTVKQKMCSRQKDKRDTHYRANIWMFVNIRPQRRHLQCLQGWSVSSVYFPILLSTLIIGFQSSGPEAQNTLKCVLLLGPMPQDGWSGIWWGVRWNPS